MKRRFLFRLAALLLAAFVALNVLACRHAYAMLHYVADGRRTRPPEALSRLERWKVLLTGVRVPRPRNTRTPSDVGLAFETHHVRFGRIDLEGWHVPAAATNGLVMAFHGYGSCKSQLLPEARLLHDLGYGVFLVDFRGSGGSSEGATTLGFLEAEDVAETVRYVHSHFPTSRPLILYGHSMGAAAILRAMATRGVAPDGVILEAVYDRMLSTVRNRFRSMGVPSFPAAELLTFWGGVQSGFWGFALNPAQYARRVRCPVLMLRGERDPRVTSEQTQAVYAQLAGPKQWHVFAGASHDGCASVQPAVWKTAVEKFLASSALDSGPR